MFKKPRHQLLLLFPALMRSGHHAIIEWIQLHFDQPQYELNDARPFAKKPFRGDLKPPTGDTVLATANFEDVDISRCAETPLIDIRLFGKVERHRHVLVLRDPLNLLASKLKFMRTREWWQANERRRDQTAEEVLALWLTMAREFAGETEYLGADRVNVSFNEWFLSREYRDDVARRIGFENKDLGVNQVSNRGAGSSFDYKQFDGRAQDMDVLNRWRAMEDDEAFRVIFDHADVMHYGELLFGSLSGRG